jgi:hypothetical protein
MQSVPRSLRLCAPAALALLVLAAIGCEGVTAEPASDRGPDDVSRFEDVPEYPFCDRVGCSADCPDFFMDVVITCDSGSVTASWKDYSGCMSGTAAPDYLACQATRTCPTGKCRLPVLPVQHTACWAELLTAYCEPPCAAEESGGSCADYLRCAWNCPVGDGSALCDQECLSKLDARGLQAFTPLKTCADSFCAGALVFNECLEANCRSARIGCAWGCKHGNCREFQDCLDACPPDEPSTDADDGLACRQSCAMDATPAAQMDLHAFLTCLEADCPPSLPLVYSRCSTDRCTVDWDTCRAAPTSCRDAYLCWTTKPFSSTPGEDEVPYGCTHDLADAERTRIDAIARCLREACFTPDAPEGFADECMAAALKGACAVRKADCVGE